MKKYPYRIYYPRGDIGTWYSYRWRDISNWCIECIGEIGNWDYLDQYFVFKNEEDKLLFMLRWKS